MPANDDGGVSLTMAELTALVDAMAALVNSGGPLGASRSTDRAPRHRRWRHAGGRPSTSLVKRPDRASFRSPASSPSLNCPATVVADARLM